MKAIFLAVSLSVLLMGCQANAMAGISSHKTTLQSSKAAMTTKVYVSNYGFDETVQRLQHAFLGKSMTVFAVIDHQKAAKEAGLDMQPATVLVFGTPKAGTPLMVKDPSFALKLPLKVLITQTNGQVQVHMTDTQALVADSQIGFDEVKNTLGAAQKLVQKTVSE